MRVRRILSVPMTLLTGPGGKGGGGGFVLGGRRARVYRCEGKGERGKGAGRRISAGKQA